MHSPNTLEEGYIIRSVQNLPNGTEEARPAAPEASPAPTLFPLETSPKPIAPVAAEPPAKPPRPPARRLSPNTKAALAEIRRELVEARQLLEELARPRLEP